MKKKVPSRIIFVVWPFIVVGCFLLVCVGECWKEVFSFSASFAELQLMTSSFDQYGNFSVSSINQMKFVDSLDFSNSLKSLLWSVHTELTKWRLWISSTQLLRRLRWSITIQILSIGWVRYQSYQHIERSLMLFQQFLQVFWEVIWDYFLEPVWSQPSKCLSFSSAVADQLFVDKETSHLCICKFDKIFYWTGREATEKNINSNSQFHRDKSHDTKKEKIIFTKCTIWKTGG